MRSIEGKMPKGIKKGAARCSICKEPIPAGIRIRAAIERDRDDPDGPPVISPVHPACLAQYLRRHPDWTDHRDDPGALPDALVRRFWVDLGRRKGWGDFIERALPLC